MESYGPTETTIWSSGFLVEKGDEPVQIGCPVANTQCYILDQFRNLVPIGVTGELYIAGDGLARGYLNQPDVTREKFVPNSFVPGKRMYRTGDFARRLPDGNIECLGRVDHQIKIRGFRVEPAEIEAALRQHPAVKRALVVAREDVPGDRYLVAYLVPSGVVAPTRSEIRDLLKQTLPDYMLPSEYVVLEEIPLSPNGKVDRRALPPPNQDRREPRLGCVAPRTPVEDLLATIWREVLHIQQISVYDNFFELGGHSLLAIQVSARLRNTINLEIPLHHIFDKPTIAQLATVIVETLKREELTQEHI